MNRDEIDRWIRYHSEISYTLTIERTALESALIPVSAYILVACVECYRRYPEMIDVIARARRRTRSDAAAINLRARSTLCTCGPSRTS